MRKLTKNQKILAAITINLGSYIIPICISKKIANYFTNILKDDFEDIEAAKKSLNDFLETEKLTMDELEFYCENSKSIKNQIKEWEEEYKKDERRYSVIVYVSSFIIGLIGGLTNILLTKKLKE